jgi:hypothetical protein
LNLKDWSEPLVNIEHLAIELKDVLNSNQHHDAEAIVKEMLDELMNLHAAILIAQWADAQIERARIASSGGSQ